jgi:hypothetical protein
MPEVVGFYNPELPAKRRVIKLMKKAYHDDRSLGTTVPVGEQVDNLLQALEELESLATVLVSHLETQDVNKVPVTSDQIVRFYVVVKRTLFNTKKLEFSRTPRLDIDSITSYLSSLKNLYSSLEELFNIHKLSIAQQFPTRRGETLTRYAEVTEYYNSLNPDVPRQEYDGIEAYLEQLDQEISGALETRRELIESAQLVRDYPGPAIEGFRARQQFERQIARAEEDIEEMQRRKRMLEQRLLELQQTIRDYEEELSGNNREEDEADVVKTMYELSVLGHPEKLVLEQFKILLDTLQTGIVLFNAGLTGRVNKVNDANRAGFAVNVPDVPEPVVGAGRYSLHSVHQQSEHRRFL